MTSYIVFLKHVLALFIGFIVFHALIAKYGPYYAAQKVYDILQNDCDGIIKKALLAYVTNDYRVKKEQIHSDYRFYLKHKDKDELSKRVIAQYSDDSLKGYGDYTYDKGGETFEEQQRGLVLPLVYQFLDQQKTPITVCEIGTANGDILAHLAQKYPKHTFIGIDFSVNTANLKHSEIKNLSFQSGYALHMIESGGLKFDMVFASSTLLVFNPKELQRYMNILSDAGCQDIIINEAYWADYDCNTTDGAYSRHLEQAVWFHNYPSYFEEANYKVQDLDIIKNYKHPKSKREDIKVLLCHAKRQA